MRRVHHRLAPAALASVWAQTAESGRRARRLGVSDGNDRGEEQHEHVNRRKGLV